MTGLERVPLWSLFSPLTVCKLSTSDSYSFKSSYTSTCHIHSHYQPHSPGHLSALLQNMVSVLPKILPLFSRLNYENDCALSTPLAKITQRFHIPPMINSEQLSMEFTKHTRTHTHTAFQPHLLIFLVWPTAACMSVSLLICSPILSSYLKILEFCLRFRNIYCPPFQYNFAILNSVEGFSFHCDVLFSIHLLWFYFFFWRCGNFTWEVTFVLLILLPCDFFDFFFKLTAFLFHDKGNTAAHV